MKTFQEPSAPEPDYLQGGYPPPPQGVNPQSGYPPANYPQTEIPPRQAGYYQSSYASPGGYPPQETYPPPGGYPAYATQPGYQPQSSNPPQYQPSHQPNPEQQPLSAAQPVYGAVPVTYVSREYTWYADMRRNNPQIKSLNAAVFIFASGGMSLAWSIGFAPGFAYLNQVASVHAQVCWFIAVIIGACISAVFINTLTRRVFYLIASILVVINGALFVLAEENTEQIIIARYCDGIAFGLALIPTIVAGSEISIKRFRGYVLGVEQLGLIAGMNIFLSISRSNSTQGSIALIFASLALIFTFMSTIESPLNYLRQGNETEAINTLRMLQKPKLLTVETYGLLHENKQLLQEDIARGRRVNILNGLIPLFSLCLFRAIVSMSLSFPIVWGFLLASVLTNPDEAEWRFYIFATMRLLGVVGAVYALDTLGRKAVSVTSLLFGGGMLIAVGFLLSTYRGLLDLGPLNSAKGLLIGYQVFAGLAAPASSCYFGEAFSISVKPYFILIAVVFENIIQIISFFAFYGSFESVSDYGYVLGGLQTVFGIYFIFFMPETKDTTLQEALKKFSRQVNAEVRV